MLETRELNSLERIIVRMITAYPFFGCLLAKLPKKFTKNIPTAAIAWNNELSSFWLEINEEFFNNLPDPEKIGLLVHEAMHLVNSHVQRNRDDLLMSAHVIRNSENYTKKECEVYIINAMLFNIACDYAINQLIHSENGRYNYNGIEVELPKHYKEDGQVVHGVDSNTFKALVKPGTEIALRETAEYYYRLLRDNLSDDVSSSAGKLVIKCKGGGDGSSQGDGASASDDGNEDGSGQQDKIISTIDDHSKLYPDGKTKAQAESSGNKMINEAAKLIKGARHDAQQRQAGSLPGGIEELITELLDSTIDWRKLIRNSFGSRLTVEKEVSYGRRDRRTKTVPGFRKASKENIIIAIDTSGSITENDLKKYFAEIEALLEQSADTDLYLAQIDTRICSFEKYSRGDWKTIKINGGGGTDMRPIFEAASQHKFVIKYEDPKQNKETYVDVDRLVLFTDGYWYGDVPAKHLNGYQITLIYTKNHSRVKHVEEHKNVTTAIIS